MALPYLGFAGYIGLGEESTWGTAVARSRYLRFNSDSLQSVVMNEQQPDLSAELDTLAPLAHFQSSTECGGSFEFYPAFGDHAFTMLLKHALGAQSTSGAGPYDHAHTLAKALPTGLTIERGYKDYQEIYEGCRVASLELDFQVGRPCVCRVDVIGEVGSAPASVNAPTFTTSPTYVLHNQVGTLNWNALTPTLKSLKVRIDNKIARRQQLGSLTTAEPARTDFIDLLIEGEVESPSNDYHNAMRARTQSDATISITSGASASMAIALNNAMLFSGWGRNASGVGPISERFTMRGFRDASSEKGFSITVTNANSAGV